MKFAKIRNYCEYHDIWYLKIPLDIPREIIKEVNDVYDNGFFVDIGAGTDGIRNMPMSFFEESEQTPTFKNSFANKRKSYDAREAYNRGMMPSQDNANVYFKSRSKH